MFKKFLLASGLAIGGFAGQSNAAEACYSWERVTTYECVTTYVCKQVPYTKTDCVYDHCGNPVYVRRTYYRTVETPVVRHVPATKWVKRYHG
jgi:hypothetical protein